MGTLLQGREQATPHHSVEAQGNTSLIGHLPMLVLGIEFKDKKDRVGRPIKFVCLVRDLHQIIRTVDMRSNHYTNYPLL